MAAFAYTAIGATGERKSGVLSAADEQSALAELDRLALTPISLRASASDEAGRTTKAASKPPPPGRLAGVYTQLADLLRAGVPLLRSIRVLANTSKGSPLEPHLAALADAVQDGKDLATAMADRGGVFPISHIAMVRAGEKGGFLESGLARLGKLVESQAALRAKVIGSLIYPCVIGIFGSVLVAAVFLLYIPQFRSVFEGIDLPWITRVLFAVSDLIRGSWLLVLMVLIAAGAGLWILSRNAAFRARLGRIPLHIPLVRSILKLLAVGRFCRVLGTLLGAGVPVLGAIEIAKEAGGLPALSEAAAKAGEEVRAGRSLADPLQSGGLFPADVLEMIRVGEAANNLDDVLITAADTLETRLDRQLSTAVRLIEPATLLLLGLIIAVIAVALILPMMRLTSGMAVN